MVPPLLISLLVEGTEVYMLLVCSDKVFTENDTVYRAKAYYNRCAAKLDEMIDGVAVSSESFTNSRFQEQAKELQHSSLFKNILYI